MDETDILEDIFGTGLSELTEKDILVAKKVVKYFVRNTDIDDEDSHLLNSCKYAVAMEGRLWEDVMMTHTRDKCSVDLRYCIFHIFWNHSGLSQSRKVKILGDKFDRTTIIHASKCVNDWYKYDKSFRQKYDRILSNVERGLKIKNT